MMELPAQDSKHDLEVDCHYQNQPGKIQWFKLVTEYGYVQQKADWFKWCLKGDLAFKDFQYVVLAGPSHPQYMNPEAQSWSLMLYEGVKKFKR